MWSLFTKLVVGLPSIDEIYHLFLATLATMKNSPPTQTHTIESQTAEKVKHLWETRDIRAFILGSLCIQALLTFFAPFRKSSASGILGFFIWVLYLSADAIAVFIIGLITKNESQSPHTKEILAFWAPFLLLHLGGPDTITALALEDNELWHRHALQLVTQVTITIYVLVLSFQHKGLLAPTMLMFVNGFWKYFERTCALYFASADSFRESLVGKPEPGPNYARLMEEYFFAKDAHIPTDFKGTDGLLAVRQPEERDVSDNNYTTNDGMATLDERLKHDEKMVMIAHHFYEMFKAILADGILSLKNRKESRVYFLESDDAFRIIEIELNLIYDRFYTKIFLFQKRRTFARLGCFIMVIVSLIIFCLKDTSIYNKVDVEITFVLLVGAIALEIWAVLMFVMSDWGIIVSALDGNFKRYFKLLTLVILKYSRWARQTKCTRWSGSISKYNLLKRFFRKPPFFFNCFSSIKRTRDILIGLFYVESQKSNETLINFVIDELKQKASRATEVEVAKEVCSARGNLVLQDDYFLTSECLTPWTLDVDYDESLLIWHLATDLCYWQSIKNEAASTDPRKISKDLSDYMSYLLLRQQTMLSSVVGMADTRFEDTCAEAKKFMNHNDTIKFSWLKDPWWKAKRFLLKILCCRCGTAPRGDEAPSEKVEGLFFRDFSKKVLEVKADVQPIVAKGDKSKSVLFDACRLAKQLELFGEKQWEITSKVWVELLCYAAVRCSPRPHIAQLSKGGEFITLVWLFMAHLGLGERFLQNQGYGWTKLIIHK